MRVEIQTLIALNRMKCIRKMENNIKNECLIKLSL